MMLLVYNHQFVFIYTDEKSKVTYADEKSKVTYADEKSKVTSDNIYFFNNI